MKSLLIIGANSDIAKAVAKRYARDSYNLVLATRTPDSLNMFAQDLKVRFGVDISCVFFDILNHESHASFYETLTPRPTGVVVAVGYLGDQQVAEKNADETRKIIDINYTGIVNFLSLVANDFEERKSGFIVGISSIAGDRGRKSSYVYGSAKAALTVYLSGLRNRLYPNKVHVLTVKPGLVDTKMLAGMFFPKWLMTSPEKVADDIFRGEKRGRNILYTAWYWKWIFVLVRLLPEWVFKRTRL